MRADEFKQIMSLWQGVRVFDMRNFLVHIYFFACPLLKEIVAQGETYNGIYAYVRRMI